MATRTLPSLILILAFINIAMSQNIGIGIDDPAVKLHIYDDSDSDIHLLVRSADSSSTIALDGWGGQAKRVLFSNLGISKASINYEAGTLRFYTNLEDILPTPAMTLVGGNVGINVGSAGLLSQQLVVNGKMKLGDDTNPPEAGTLRYNYTDSIIEYHDGLSWHSSTTPWLASGSKIHYDNGAVLVGRTNTIGAERFGIRIDVGGASYGGMYVETNGNANSKPFYGYAVDNSPLAWHYYDGGTSTWKLYNSGEHLAVTNTGKVGVGFTTPGNKLDIKSSGPLDTADIVLGLISDGSDRPTIQFSEWSTAVPNSGMSIEYDGAGLSGDANRLHIRGVDVARKFTFTSGGYLGVGIQSPNDELHIYRSSGVPSLKIESDNGNATIRLDASAGNTGTSQIRFTENNGLSGAIWYDYSTDALMFYESGSTMYLQNGRVGIGSLPNINYKLSVNGKMIAEELKVQLSENWPDYVFTEDYSLMSLGEMEYFIRKHGHLPGIPSSSEVEEAGGIDLGEMNRLLLEKIEELTLHMISQQKEIDYLKSVIRSK